MKDAARRLAVAVDAMRIGGGSAVEQQTQQRELVQALMALQCLWRPQLLANPLQHKKRSAKSNAALFQLLLATLVVYSGGHTGNTSAGAAGGTGVSLSTSSVHTSESVHRLICELLVRTFDFSVAPTVTDALMAKNTSLYVKVSLVMVVCRLPEQQALQFLPDVLALTNKSLRAVDYYMKQSLVESVAHALERDSRRLVDFHAEALKIVTKCYQDKAPEVRIAAAKLLQVVTERTAVSMAASTGSGVGGNQGGGSTSGGAGNSGAAAGSGSGGSHAGANGVSLDAILQITAKGMDDVAPEARRAYSVVVGTVLAKYATSSGDAEVQAGDNNGASAGSVRNNDDDIGGRSSTEHDTPTSSGGGKSKSGFKLHVPGMTTINLPASLSRRKAATVNFSTIANVVLYFKDMVTSKYLSTNPNQSHGGILSSFSIALCGMFERLPPDAIAESQLREVMDAILAILDHPFALGDLTRARNAVGFVLRYGLNGCLTERQQEVLLGAYLQKLTYESQAAESNHHKTLAALVELSHMFHSMGEASVTHARDASDVLQKLLSHGKQSVRFQAAVALASLVTAIPYRLKSVLTSCLQGLRDTAEYLMRGGSDLDEMRSPAEADKTDDGQEDSDMQNKTHLYAIQGRSAAIVHILRALKLDANGGLSQAVMDDIYSISEELVESQFLSECADSIWLTCTRAGWTLVGSLVAMNDEQWIKANLEKLLNLWLKSSVLHSRESSLELLRIEAAVIALSSLLFNSQAVAIDPDNDVNLLASHVLHVYLTATQDSLSNPLKRRGQIARYRLLGWIINCFSMLPPIYSDSYIVLLDLIAEFTTAQALTNLRHSPLVPAKSTYLQSVLSSEDDALDVVTLSRLVPGDYPSPLYSRELNHALGLQQRGNALTDTEVEVQYLDTFWRSMSEKAVEDGVSKQAGCSPFTYIRLVDASVNLFGRLFHSVPEDLQLRCLQHYAGALTDVRAECEVNVCSLLFAVIAEARRLEKTGTAPTSSASLSATSWPLQIQTMLCEMISSENAEVRRGAGEALGALALLLDEDHCKALVIDLEKRLVVEKLPQGASNALYGSNADLDVSVLLAGAAFALACIKRVCGSRISIDTGLIFRFAGECSQPLRTWILHSWSIVLESVNSSGGDYEQFVSSTFSLMEAHFLAGFVYSKVNKRGLRWQISTKVALGRIINEVVATLGPELGGSNDRLNDFYSYWILLRQDGDARIEFEFLKFLEQVVVFAPSRFQSADLRYILRIVSDTALVSSAASAVLTTPQTSGFSALSPPSRTEASLAVLGAYDESFEQNGLVNVGVFTNGWSRSILQNICLSCLRTLVERDPTLVRRQNLFCLLFSALHVEFNELMWDYLPGLHGMWDLLSFSFADSMTMQRNGIGALQRTALTLLDVEGRDHERGEPCLWALLCRSIAIGESASTFAGVDAEELMMSPKGMNSGIQATGNAEAAENDMAWSPTQTLDMAKTDESSLVSAAAAAQVATWRATKASVGELISLMPPLSRQVRHFAVECVLRVFELMSSVQPSCIGVYQRKQLHFDLAAARRYFFEMLSSGAELPVSGESPIGNYMCLYLDEFVTLACHVTTTSVEGDELLMFQCAGVRLLNVLVKNFASARDPEVTSGDAYLLDPYRAQLSSAIRHALKQVQVESSLLTSAMDKEKEEERYFYAPLLLEAHGVAGACVSAHLIQDKVGLGRILKAVMTHDYGHAHFIGDEPTRICLSLANLASVGELLTSSITEAIAKKNTRDDVHQLVTMSPLVKAMTTGLLGTTEYLYKCWIDTTFAYGVVMQGCSQWPQLDEASSASSLGNESMVMPALQIPLPPMGSAADASAVDLIVSKSLRTLYKRYWPKIISAMAAVAVYLQHLVTVSNTRDGNNPKWSSVLLSFAIFHVNTNARDRMEDDTELPAVLRSIPLLLRAATETSEKQQSSSSYGFPVLLTTALNTLMLASKRCVGLARIEAMKAIFSCLSQENLAFARQICRSGDEEHLSATLFDVVRQAGFCPTEVVCQLCDANEQTRHARAVSIGSKDTNTRCVSGVSSEDAKHMTEVVQLATTGIVLLHTTEEARSGVVRSIALVQQIICSVAGGDHSSSVKQAVVKLNRASTESVLALARMLEAENDSNEILTRIKSAICNSFDFLAEWLKVDIHTAPEFAMQIAANYAVKFPLCLQGDAGRFHAEVAEDTSSMLELTSEEEDGGNKQQRISARAELLRGLNALVKKLVDGKQISNANRYLVALGPSLVEIVSATSCYPETSAELAELDEAEKLLRLLTSQLSDQHGATFVHMLLPRLAVVLSHPASPATDNAISTRVPGILARLLLCFAQTHGSAFKEAVGAMTPALRGVLETALRIALTGSAPTAASRQPSVPAASKLDLSRFG